MKNQIEYVAKQIVKLVRDEGYKYSDISIITKNVENISSIAKAVFNKYEIPIYIDGKEVFETIIEQGRMQQASTGRNAFATL